jgi:hypothetical protein
MKRSVPELKAERTDDNAQEAMETPFLITTSELRERQTLRRRKLHLSIRSEAIRRLVGLRLKAKEK